MLLPDDHLTYYKNLVLPPSERDTSPSLPPSGPSGAASAGGGGPGGAGASGGAPGNSSGLASLPRVKVRYKFAVTANGRVFSHLLDFPHCGFAEVCVCGYVGVGVVVGVGVGVGVGVYFFYV